MVVVVGLRLHGLRSYSRALRYEHLIWFHDERLGHVEDPQNDWVILWDTIECFSTAQQKGPLLKVCTWRVRGA